MARRQVTNTRKDADGDIIALCNPGLYWSPVTKEKAIQEIDDGANTYFVRVDYQEVEIHVVEKTDGKKHLRTDRDKTSKNNLEDLPDC